MLDKKQLKIIRQRAATAYATALNESAGTCAPTELTVKGVRQFRRQSAAIGRELKKQIAAAVKEHGDALLKQIAKAKAAESKAREKKAAKPARGKKSEKSPAQYSAPVQPSAH